MVNYRIVRIAGFHFRQLVKDLYMQNPDLGDLSYNDQQEILFENGYVYSDSLSKGMRMLGHDAHELIFDMEMLQKRWADENGFQYSSENWKHEILLKQIETLKPDILYFQDIHSMPHSTRRELKKNCSGIKLIALFKGFPGSVKSFDELDDVDVVFAGTPTLARQFKDAGLNTHLIYHCFNSSVLEKVNGKEDGKKLPEYDFTFTGSSGHGYGGHRGRFWMLVELIKKTDIKLWVDDREDGKIDGIDKLPEVVREALEKDKAWAASLGEFPMKALKEMYPMRCRPAVFGLDMYRILCGSKVTLNKDPDALLDCVGNIRIFEATGVGTCVLTNSGSNMADIFDEDYELVTYANVDECIEKLNYLLDNDEARKRIAKAGQIRTLRDHTMFNRCQEINDIFQKML